MQRVTRAQIEAALAQDTTVDITTTGRRTGKPRTIEIWFLAVAGRIFVTGTPGRRDWLANLHADPHLTLHLKESVNASLAAVATPVTDEATRRMVLEAASASWYRQQVSDLDHLVDAAPMVELTLELPEE